LDVYFCNSKFILFNTQVRKGPQWMTKLYFKRFNATGFLKLNSNSRPLTKLKETWIISSKHSWVIKFFYKEVKIGYRLFLKVYGACTTNIESNEVRSSIKAAATVVLYHTRQWTCCNGVPFQYMAQSLTTSIRFVPTALLFLFGI
jgi:hypothetical protein